MSADGGSTGRRPRPGRAHRGASGDAVRRLSAVTLLAALLTVLAAGCTGDPSGGPTDRPRVVAAFYPLEFVARQVAGPDATVTGLAPPGVDAHDLELTGSQVARIAEADLVVHLAGFQPAVDEAVATHARGDTLDVAALVGSSGAAGDTADGRDDGHGHGAADPHVWLDPLRLAVIADELAARLAEAAPAHATAYADRATRLRAELVALDEEFTGGLADCRRREFVVGHAAFTYLAERYDLRQIAVSGLSPEDEPTPAALAEAVRLAREHGATTIYYETLAGPRVAEVIAAQVGAAVAPLDPLETAPTDGDYLTRMRENLTALRAGLECR